MSIEDKIKTWVILDNQMNKCNLQIKDIRNKKNVITKDIVNNFNEKNMNFPVINISDGKLTICETQHSNVISFKFLLDCFKEYLNDDDEANKLLNYVKNKRTFTYVSSIKRIYNKD